MGVFFRITEDSHCRNCKAMILSDAVLNKALVEFHKILSSNTNLKGITNILITRTDL